MFEELKMKLEGTNGTNVESHNGVYARAVSLQLKNLMLPTEYIDAVSDKQSVKEDIALAKNQRNQELTKANTELFAVQAETKKILDNALNDVNVTLTAADLTAAQTMFTFAEETETIQQAKEVFNLDTNGVLSYMANQLYAEAPTLRASIREPAKVSRRDEL